ncbi:hypothetical protein R3P38DRAFT_179436 [Favolaschia claudopus]|uniref:Uncharacterized protein n=1 Tax=Favolaschia claudopus TaxID=2862362 RepID=A0AAW0CXN3_9AGAR
MEKLCSTSSFPALREIEHPCCVWPVTGPEVSRSKWAEWAESLLERNVHLHGPDGVRWRPRLKFVKYSK